MGGKVAENRKGNFLFPEEERREKKRLPQPRLERGSLALVSGRQES